MICASLLSSSPALSPKLSVKETTFFDKSSSNPLIETPCPDPSCHRSLPASIIVPSMARLPVITVFPEIPNTFLVFL